MESAQPEEVVDFLLSHQIIPRSFVQELGGDLSRFSSSDELTQELVRLGRLTEFQREHLLSGQGQKLIFGQYRLVQPLGKGGMGEVFKAWQPRLNRYIALKFVHKEYLDAQTNALSRFQREANAIAQLQHANVVVLHDADEIDGIPFIAMEFIDGVSLTDLVRRNGPLGVKQACEYMRQTALGLQHAFECGFIHRDIKPSNIVVSLPKKGSGSSPSMKKLSLVTLRDLKQKSEDASTLSAHQVKILDMGLARLSESLTSGQALATPLTATGAVVGTPDYLSPEQARNSATVDIRADLYSLGCTFYFILSGRPPFAGGSPIEKMLQHQLDAPPPLDSLRRGVPDTVNRIVERLLAKKPDDRFQTPLELVGALSKYLAASTTEPEPPSPANNVTRTTIPELFATPQTLVPIQGTNDPDAEPQPCDEVPPDASFECLPGFANAPIPWARIEEGSLDRPEASQTALGNSTIRPVETGIIASMARLEGHSGVVGAVAASRDGTLAVSGDVNGRVQIWDLRDPIPRAISSLNRGGEIQSVAFAPDDSDCVFIGELRQGNGALARWNWRSGLAMDWGNCANLQQKGIGHLCLTGDGQLLAAAVGSLAVSWQPRDGIATNCRVYKGLDRPIRALAVSPDRLLLAAAGEDKSIHFWDLQRGRWNQNARVRLNLQRARVTTMCFSPDGSLLALGGLDAEIVLWTLIGDKHEPLRVLQGHSSNLLHVQFIDDGSRLVSIGADGQILFWDVATASIESEFRLDLTMAYRVAMSEDATRLVAGFANGVVAIYGLPSMPKREQPPETSRPHRGLSRRAVHA